MGFCYFRYNASKNSNLKWSDTVCRCVFAFLGCLYTCLLGCVWVSFINQSDQSETGVSASPESRKIVVQYDRRPCGPAAIDGTRFATFPAHDAKQLICQMSALYHPYLSLLPALSSQLPGSLHWISPGFRISVKTHYALRHFRGPVIVAVVVDVAGLLL